MTVLQRYHYLFTGRNNQRLQTELLSGLSSFLNLSTNNRLWVRLDESGLHEAQANPDFSQFRESTLEYPAKNRLLRKIVGGQ